MPTNKFTCPLDKTHTTLMGYVGSPPADGPYCNRHDAPALMATSPGDKVDDSTPLTAPAVAQASLPTNNAVVISSASVRLDTRANGAIIQNQGAVNLYVGPDASVSLIKGRMVVPGESYKWPFASPCYGISTLAGTVVNVLEG